MHVSHYSNYKITSNGIIIIIGSKLAQLGLEESSEVEGLRRPKYTQMNGKLSIFDILAS